MWNSESWDGGKCRIARHMYYLFDDAMRTMQSVRESEGKRAGVARSSREKIYYQIKFLTGDIALSFRFGRAFVRLFCTFDAILRLLQDHLLHIPFDSFAISDCSMCTNKIYFLFAYRALFYHFFSLVPYLMYGCNERLLIYRTK